MYVCMCIYNLCIVYVCIMYICMYICRAYVLTLHIHVICIIHELSIYNKNRKNGFKIVDKWSYTIRWV